MAREPLFAQGKIEILDHPELSRELRLLERRPRPGGKVIIDHPRGSHDDFANSLAICCGAAARQSFIIPVAVGQRLINRAKDFLDQDTGSGSSINESWDAGRDFVDTLGDMFAPGTRIFSPLPVAGLCDTICTVILYLFERLTAVFRASDFTDSNT